jgi:hypothetical protein
MIETAKELKEVQNGDDLRFELRLWINKIKFCKLQIEPLQKHLEKIVRHYGDIELMAEVERYQNKFIVYNDVGDKLVKELKFLRNSLNDLKEKNLGNAELKQKIKGEKENKIRRSESYINIIEELKNNFIFFYTSNYTSENHIVSKK